MDINQIQNQLEEFCLAREWNQFHNPKNLSMALAGEAGELLEIFQWMSVEQSISLSELELQKVEEEIADIFIYLLRLSDKLNIDIEKSVARKLEINAVRYPIDKSRGTSKKYTDLE